MKVYSIVIIALLAMAGECHGEENGARAYLDNKYGEKAKYSLFEYRLYEKDMHRIEKGDSRCNLIAMICDSDMAPMNYFNPSGIDPSHPSFPGPARNIHIIAQNDKGDILGGEYVTIYPDWVVMGFGKIFILKQSGANRLRYWDKPIKNATQQVDSAEPSTNAVPPFVPPGSAR